jgi:dTDP-4-amino-4,6-dideoxygalactose transaminase
MSKRKLALNGGVPLITESFPRYNPIGREELDAAHAVIESGRLSDFLGSWGPGFFGGEQVKAFEEAWASHFGVEHAVSMNSNTSGLVAALGAVGLSPGDEVIVSPWTMSATATAILVWNAIPVFADIEEETFNLGPASIERNVTEQTRAILVTDIFGHPAEYDEIGRIAEKHGLAVIEDAAQAPGASYKGRPAGTLADIGVFSLNFHKHIHTGEGGVCVTNDLKLAERLQLIRNHGEAVVEAKGELDISNIIGFNFRLTEVQAAIGIEQLKKLDRIVAAKSLAATRLSDRLNHLGGLRTPIVKEDCIHSFYGYPFLVDDQVIGVPRDRIVEALRAEGLLAAGGYCNLHLLPMYQQRIAYGTGGFPWTSECYQGNVSYDKGICPVAERLHERDYMTVGWALYKNTDEQVDLTADVFEKIWDHLDELRAPN